MAFIISRRSLRSKDHGVDIYITFSTAVYYSYFVVNIAAILHICKHEVYYNCKTSNMFMTNVMCAHMVTICIFVCNNTIKKEAAKGLYFLPLIHLRKLLMVITQGRIFGDLQSESFDALCNVVVASVEAGPQLLLQSCGAILSIITTKATIYGRAGIAIASGESVYSASALLVRCMGYSSLINILLLLEYNISVYYTTLISYYCAALCLPAIVLWRAMRRAEEATLHTRCSWKRIHVLGVSMYLSLLMGPLYPLLKIGSAHKKCFVDFILSIIAQLLPDIAVFVIISSKWDALLTSHCNAIIYCPYHGKKTYNSPYPAMMIVIMGCGVCVNIVALCCFVLLDLKTRNEENQNISLQESHAPTPRLRFTKTEVNCNENFESRLLQGCIL
eukprot:Gb_00560 [translate_table: standard]